MGQRGLTLQRSLGDRVCPATRLEGWSSRLCLTPSLWLSRSLSAFSAFCGQGSGGGGAEGCSVNTGRGTRFSWQGVGVHLCVCACLHTRAHMHTWPHTWHMLMHVCPCSPMWAHTCSDVCTCLHMLWGLGLCLVSPTSPFVSLPVLLFMQPEQLGPGDPAPVRGQGVALLAPLTYLHLGHLLSPGPASFPA